MVARASFFQGRFRLQGLIYPNEVFRVQGSGFSFLLVQGSGFRVQCSAICSLYVRYIFAIYSAVYLLYIKGQGQVASYIFAIYWLYIQLCIHHIFSYIFAAYSGSRTQCSSMCSLCIRAHHARDQQPLFCIQRCFTLILSARGNNRTCTFFPPIC